MLTTTLDLLCLTILVYTTERAGCHVGEVFGPPPHSSPRLAELHRLADCLFFFSLVFFCKLLRLGPLQDGCLDGKIGGGTSSFFG
jgi:hypothetical protein